MYKGIVGPIPFLHWFINSDGEFSYQLTEFEMFIHLLALGIAAYLTYKYYRKRYSKRIQ